MTDKKVVGMGAGLTERSFEALFREYFPSLMAFARKFLPDEDDAREVIHQVFVNLWEKRDTLDGSSSFKSYLFTSVHNRSLNTIRDRKKFTAQEDAPEAADAMDIEAHMEGMELEQRIGEVIESLPEKCREIFEMNRFEGLKYGEIAEKLNISIKTVENQMSKALKILREKLSAYLTILLWILFNAMN